MPTPRRRCTSCKLVLPATYFSRLSRNRSGYLTICKACRGAQRRTRTAITLPYWIAAPEGIIPAYLCSACEVVLPTAMFRADPRGFARKVMTCRPCTAAKRRAYNGEHRPHVREVQKAYRGTITDKIKMRNKRSYDIMMADADKRARQYARSAAWYAAHPEVTQTKNALRTARIKGATIRTLTRAEWEEIKAAYHYRCIYCETKPAKLTMDHITPLSKGGIHTKSNVVPACKSCNSKKRDRQVLKPIQPLLL
jgi:5-methylcytosine-specific restriction endonuclease McrA